MQHSDSIPLLSYSKDLPLQYCKWVWSSQPVTKTGSRKGHLWAILLCSLEHSLHPGLSHHHLLSCWYFPDTSVVPAPQREHGTCELIYKCLESSEPAAYCLIQWHSHKGKQKSTSCDKLICLLFLIILAVQSHLSLPWLLGSSELYALSEQLPLTVFWYNYLPLRVLLSITRLSAFNSAYSFWIFWSEEWTWNSTNSQLSWAMKEHGPRRSTDLGSNPRYATYTLWDPGHITYHSLRASLAILTVLWWLHEAETPSTAPGHTRDTQRLH